MKITFNNDNELVVDYFSVADGMMLAKSQWSEKEYILNLFQDPLAMSKIIYEDAENIEHPYENYTQFEEIREDKNGAITVVMSRNGYGTIDKVNTLLEDMQNAQENISKTQDDIEKAKEDIEQTKTDVEQAKNDIRDLQEGGASNFNVELFNAAVFIARDNAQSYSDEDALKVKSIYEKWKDLVDKDFTAKESEYKFTHENVLYKTIKENQKFQENWIPGQGTESIFARIDETHSGTLEDPIPYYVNMEVFKDKYYTEDGVLYKCTRDSEQALHNKASELVGHYFEIIDNK